MNIEHNNQPGADGTANNTSSNPVPAPPEQTVDPKLLYEFLQPYPLSYEQWMDSLRFRVATAEAIGRRENLDFRGIVSVNGEDAITWRFAHGLAQLSYGLPGVLVLIAIRESFEKPFPSINCFLTQYCPLAVAGSDSSARMLREFLQVDDEFDPWIKRHIKTLQMKSGRDYTYRMVPNAPIPKQMVIPIQTAERIVLATGTPRALHAQKLLAESNARRKSCQGW